MGFALRKSYKTDLIKHAMLKPIRLSAKLPVMYLEAALHRMDKIPQSMFDEMIEKYVEMNVAHPFREGNTRATAVFIIKYLKTLGFEVSNEVFAEHSWYFRNALVRANYNDLKNDIHATTKYLELFFENFLMDRHHQLKNRYLHVDYSDEKEIQSAAEEISKCKNCTLDCTLDEFEILKIISKNPAITQKQLAAELGKSERTVKNRTKVLQEKGYIKRLGGKRNGRWELLVELQR